MPRRLRASEDRQVVLLRRLDAAQAEWRATRRRHRVLARNQCVLLAAVDWPLLFLFAFWFCFAFCLYYYLLILLLLCFYCIALYCIGWLVGWLVGCWDGWFIDLYWLWVKAGMCTLNRSEKCERTRLCNTSRQEHLRTCTRAWRHSEPACQVNTTQGEGGVLRANK